MEQITELKCACSSCGQVIEYPPEAAGQIVECPKCREKSRLPESSPSTLTKEESPQPTTPPRLCPVCDAPMAPYGSTCENCEILRRRKLNLIIGVVSAIVVLAVGWLFLKKFYSTRQAPPVSPPAHAILQQPRVKTPKSMKDFKISTFWLESKRGSDVVVAAGDIQNTSANLYLHLKANVDLLDAKGVKIGAVTDEINELLPDKTWRFIATVKDHRAKTARFAGVKEIP
jgi:hypothetical protein